MATELLNLVITATFADGSTGLDALVRPEIVGEVAAYALARL